MATIPAGKEKAVDKRMGNFRSSKGLYVELANDGPTEKRCYVKAGALS
jgi:hypothetical protein